MAKVQQKALKREDFLLHDSDTGSSAIQIVRLTEDIKRLTGHSKENPKDHSSRRGLLKKVATRKKLMAYLKRTDEERYLKIGRLVKFSQSE